MYVNRYLENPVKKDLKRKMVFVGGPRQTGKTSLAKHLLKKVNQDLIKWYMNWDSLEDREKIMREIFPAG